MGFEKISKVLRLLEMIVYFLPILKFLLMIALMVFCEGFMLTTDFEVISNSCRCFGSKIVVVR